MLAPLIHELLVEVAALLDASGIEYEICGSAMLCLSGLDIPVGDLDLAVAAADEHRVREALAGWRLEEPPSHEPWRTSWFIRATPPDIGAGRTIDIMGGLALMIDGTVAEIPMRRGGNVSLGARDYPVASLAHWYHVYRVYDPKKAALVAGALSDEAILLGARELQIADTFSPTLIVRIKG